MHLSTLPYVCICLFHMPLPTLFYVPPSSISYISLPSLSTKSISNRCCSYVITLSPLPYSNYCQRFSDFPSQSCITLKQLLLCAHVKMTSSQEQCTLSEAQLPTREKPARLGISIFVINSQHRSTMCLFSASTCSRWLSKLPLPLPLWRQREIVVIPMMHRGSQAASLGHTLLSLGCIPSGTRHVDPIRYTGSNSPQATQQQAGRHPPPSS